MVWHNQSLHAQAITPDSITATNKIKKMKEFILLVRVPTTYTAEQAKAVNPEWDIVLNKWKADNYFVTSFVFPGESHVLEGANGPVKKEPVLSGNVKAVSSIILRAANTEEAVELARACPILNYGGTVEVKEIQPRPVRPGN